MPMIVLHCCPFQYFHIGSIFPPCRRKPSSAGNLRSVSRGAHGLGTGPTRKHHWDIHLNLYCWQVQRFNHASVRLQRVPGNVLIFELRRWLRRRRPSWSQLFVRVSQRKSWTFQTCVWNFGTVPSPAPKWPKIFITRWMAWLRRASLSLRKSQKKSRRITQDIAGRTWTEQRQV